MFVNLCDSLAFSQESFLKIFKNKIIKKIVKIYSNSSLHQNIGKLLTYIFLEQQLEQWLRKLGCLAVKSSFSDDKKFSQYMLFQVKFLSKFTAPFWESLRMFARFINNLDVLLKQRSLCYMAGHPDKLITFDWLRRGSQVRKQTVKEIRASREKGGWGLGFTTRRILG